MAFPIYFSALVPPLLDGSGDIPIGGNNHVKIAARRWLTGASEQHCGPYSIF